MNVIECIGEKITLISYSLGPKKPIALGLVRQVLVSTWFFVLDMPKIHNDLQVD